MELRPNDQFSLLPNDLIFTVRTEYQDATTTSLETALASQTVDHDRSGETGSVVSKTSSSHDGNVTDLAMAVAGTDQAPTVSNVRSEASIGNSGRTRKLPSWLLSSSGDIEAKPKAKDRSLSAATSGMHAGSCTATSET